MLLLITILCNYFYLFIFIVYYPHFIFSFLIAYIVVRQVLHWGLTLDSSPHVVMRFTGASLSDKPDLDS